LNKLRAKLTFEDPIFSKVTKCERTIKSKIKKAFQLKRDFPPPHLGQPSVQWIQPRPKGDIIIYQILTLSVNLSQLYVNILNININ